MERTDVRARQAAWLTLVLPAAIVLTAAMAFVKIPAHTWPWVLAVLPATIGAAAGLIPLISLLGPAPFPGRPGGNPLDGFSDESGDQVRHSTAVQWLGLPTGLITGLFCAWLGILSLFPQGIVALVLGSVHAKVHGWFLALHFSAPDRVLISTGFILAGLTMLASAAAMVWTTRRRQRNRCGLPGVL
ncbi:MAG TPA: hypothetical protein VN969_09815 [Streptosporangiaceae bacterium]|nr:hypothetical protein [Streptosporangiaceae bacterium]